MTFRILRDEDFQRLTGLASEVHRIKQGLTIVLQAAKVVSKHKDSESIEMLILSASMLAESGIMPERDGHGEFKLTAQEVEESRSDEFDVQKLDVPRPTL